MKSNRNPAFVFTGKFNGITMRTSTDCLLHNGCYTEMAPKRRCCCKCKLLGTALKLDNCFIYLVISSFPFCLFLPKQKAIQKILNFNQPVGVLQSGFKPTTQARDLQYSSLITTEINRKPRLLSFVPKFKKIPPDHKN